MLVLSRYPINGDLEANARAAIKASFEEYHDEPPNAVLVRSGITTLTSIVVGLGKPAVMMTIPIVVRDDSIINLDEFGLDESHGTLESLIGM
jgi:hypothetical protein